MSFVVADISLLTKGNQFLLPSPSRLPSIGGLVGSGGFLALLLLPAMNVFCCAGDDRLLAGPGVGTESAAWTKVVAVLGASSSH